MAVSYRKLIILLAFLYFICIFVAGMNVGFPSIGHDFQYNIPHLLAGKWHFFHQGFAPFRYTPHFCGGMPQYGNLHDMSYSLVQLLILFIDPWIAIVISTICTLLIGYVGWYLFGKHVLQCSKDFSHLLAISVVSIGFYFVHIVVGHLTYQSIPLIGWLFWTLFDQRKDTRIYFWTRTSIFSFVSAWMMYSGGFMSLFYFSILFVCFLPLSVWWMWSRGKLTTFAKRTAAAALLSLAICGSKITAILSFMRFYPRHVPFDKFNDHYDSITYLIKALWTIPQQSALFAGGAPGEIHELSSFISPVTLLGFACIFVLIFQYQKILLKNWIVVGYFCVYFLLLFYILLSAIRGEFEIIQKIPIFSSMHVATRLVYVPALALCIVGILSLSMVAKNASKRFQYVAVWGYVATVLIFFIAHQPGLKELRLGEPYDLVQKKITESSYLLNKVQMVKSGEGDFHYVMDGATGLSCYEPLINSGGNPQTQFLHEGPVTDIVNGKFNLMNPACYQYPKENNCMPGTPIDESDSVNLEAFRSGQPVTWKISKIQRLTDWISLITLICISVFFWLFSSLGTKKKKGAREESLL